jgi:hypothetical protein
MFAGYAAGAVVRADEPPKEGAFSIPLDALAERGRAGVRLEFSSRLNSQAVATPEDAEALRLLVEMIEGRLVVDLQAEKEAELRGRLERREAELEHVLSRVVGAQESERAAISADLHDGVAQQVAALHRRLELLRLDMQPDTPASHELDALIGVARSAVADLRGVISGLRPPSLDDLGVVAALHEEARGLEAGGHEVVIADRLPSRLPGWLETLLFRIGQEALNNVVKHAPGASVRLDVAIDPDGEGVVLSVEDAGGRRRDPASDDDGPRFGLEIMRERLAAVAGKLETASTPNGFRIRAVVPLAGL